MRWFLRRRQYDESGQGLMEYMFVVGLVSVAAMGALGLLSGSIITNLYDLAAGLFP